ncbi:translation initiation factor IF-2 [Herbivorax sp. ANBcel31]|uniref:translation initiation factor IF-2 n=1 Tax=Herbivorax sp. ANBcel31 TaxID=3069754 RepID=UPI0027B21F46|nr:translation initiation factor IF-2 [Herbivorax sp. ANBcel31]MDQ2086896.1 translation initiation factor IF-2 [Herbivorax sp. ANBcel31]
MTKKRVYELAKELNTTSKRLIEKLSEIDIVVKNHMSLLEGKELDSLYDYIGVIRHDKEKDVSDDRKKSIPLANNEAMKKDSKKAPRIIRKTEINLDTEDKKDTSVDGKSNNYKNQKRAGKGGNKKRKNEYVKVATSTSGLRPGLVRETKPDLKKNTANKPSDKKKEKSQLSENKMVEKSQEKNSQNRDDLSNERKNEAIKTKYKENQPANFKKDSNQFKQDDDKKLNNVKSVEDSKGKKQFKDEKKEKSNEVKKENVSDKKFDKGKKDNNKSGKPQETSSKQTNNRHTNNKQTTDKQTNDKQARYGQKNNRQNENRKTDFKNRDSAKNNVSRSHGTKGGNRQESKGINQKDKNVNRSAKKPLEIPKAELTPMQKEELNNQQRSERRDFKGNKDVKKDNKPKKPFNSSKNKNKPNKNIFGAKKEVKEILSDDRALDEFYSDGKKKPKKMNKNKKEVKKEKYIPPKAVLTSVKLPETMTVKEFAESIKKASAEIIKRLMNLGVMATVNQEIDFDTASIIADEYGIKAEKQIVVNEEDILFDDSEDENEEGLESRPPVVVVMGHVDHGKTSLLDAIKETNIIDSEAGGITQHIGAYMVNANNRDITFLDTPGHEAFTAMRARGAQVTDVAILVVAADDGVMPQTIEAINHAKAANVTIIVAINKMDKPGANPDRVKQELTEHGLISEEWGGETICVEVSAKNRKNIDNLLEMVLLASDILELKANPNRQAKGTVVEAKLDRDRGPIATMLVQRGTLNHGDSIVTGALVGRIRAMANDKGQKITKAGPSTPVEILGLPEVPKAGEIFYAITDEKVAKQLVEKRKQKQREQHLNSTARVSLDDLFNQIQAGEVKELNIIVKADVQGSVEAVKQSLEKLTDEEVRVRIVHGGVGAVTESDVTLAQVSNAIIIGFNVRTAGNVTEIAKDAGVDLRLYTIIYNAIEDIQAAMKGLLDPTYREVVTGHVEIRQTFKVSGIGTIGGAYVTDGKIVRNSSIRLVRDGIVVHEGKLASLKRFKDDVKEVAQGYECGLSLERYNDIKEGDVIEVYVMEEVEK